MEQKLFFVYCRCPSEFTGPRCEDRRDDDDLKPIKEKLATFPSKNKENSPIAVAFILFCVLSAMFSSIVTSAICYRLQFDVNITFSLF